MNKNKKNGQDIPVEYLEEKDSPESAGTPSEEKPEETIKPSPKTKKDKYKKAYEEYVEKYRNLNEQFLRFRAEFANYKKRVEREQIEYTDYLKGEFLKKLLPVLDDFNHMLDKTEQGTSEESVLEGAKLINDKLFKILASDGLEKIEAEGMEFDPQVHEAMMMQKTTDKKNNHIVLSVFQDGYKLKERLLRPAKVIVGDYQEESS